jgi:branched-chain amino acid transport system ATP-binding protein
MSLLKISNLDAGHGLLKAVGNFSLNVEAGEKIALIGANGAGKTTLLRTLAGVHPIAAGKIEFDGVDISLTQAYKRTAAGLALVPEGRRLFSSMTVAENLLIAQSANRQGAWHFDSVLDALPQLKEKLNAQAGTLSGGQQQAVAIGRALMTNPKLLLLDEVSLGLSPVAVQAVYESLERLFESKTALVLVEQDLKRAMHVADRIVCMLEGKIVAIGRSNEMSREEILNHYFGHDKALHDANH